MKAWVATALALLMTGGCAHAPLPPPPVLPPIDPLPPVLDIDLTPVELASMDSLTLPPATPEGLPPGVDLADFDIPIQFNERVQHFIDLFASRYPERFATWLVRQGRYEDFIEGKLRERGLPSELIYLALIESGFQPEAYSRAHAVGLWQFVSGTARMEGLEVSDWIDDRRDPRRSTIAALDHLEALYKRFGSWYLAAAAYNSGSGRVERALEAQAGGARGADSLFWSIQDALPRETRDYVPMFLAAAIIGGNREAFGFGELAVDPPEQYETVTVPDATDLKVIARAAGVSLDTIQALNPRVYHGTTPPGRAIDVHVPVGTGGAFRAAYALIPPDDRVAMRHHVVRRSETLSGIALRFGSTVSAIQKANGLPRPDRIRAGQKLRIPTGSAIAAVSARSRAGRSGARSTYRVRAGDTIWEIARAHGVRPADLLRWNGLTEDAVIRPGDRLSLIPTDPSGTR